MDIFFYFLAKGHKWPNFVRLSTCQMPGMFSLVRARPMSQTPVVIFLFSISMRPRRPHVTNEIMHACVQSIDMGSTNVTAHFHPNQNKPNEARRLSRNDTPSHFIEMNHRCRHIPQIHSSNAAAIRFYNISARHTAREIAFSVLSFVVFRSNKSLLASHPNLYEERQTSRAVFTIYFLRWISHSSFSSGRSILAGRAKWVAENSIDGKIDFVLDWKCISIQSIETNWIFIKCAFIFMQTKWNKIGFNNVQWNESSHWRVNRKINYREKEREKNRRTDTVGRSAVDKMLFSFRFINASIIQPKSHIVVELYLQISNDSLHTPRIKCTTICFFFLQLVAMQLIVSAASRQFNWMTNRKTCLIVFDGNQKCIRTEYVTRFASSHERTSCSSIRFSCIHSDPALLRRLFFIDGGITITLLDKI